MNGLLDIHPKVAASTGASAAAVLLVWVAAQLGLPLPDAVAGATIVLATFIAGWLAPGKSLPKIAATTLGSAAAVVLVWALTQLGVDVTADVAAEIVSVLTFAAGWLAPLKLPTP